MAAGDVFAEHAYEARPGPTSDPGAAGPIMHLLRTGRRTDTQTFAVITSDGGQVGCPEQVNGDLSWEIDVRGCG